MIDVNEQERNNERRRETQRAYYARNRDAIAQKQRDDLSNLHETNPERYERLKEQRSIAFKKYYDANRERHLENMRNYAKENRDNLNKKQRERYNKQKQLNISNT